MTLEPTPSADIFKSPTWAPDWGWSEVPGTRLGRQGLKIIEERLEESRGKGRTMEGSKNQINNKKGMNNKEGKEEQWKRGKAKPEKRTKGDQSSGKEKPSIVHPLLPSLPWFFLSLFSFHSSLPSLPWSFLSLSIVHPFLPSLPWFFLSLFILQAFPL